MDFFFNLKMMSIWQEIFITIQKLFFLIFFFLLFLVFNFIWLFFYSSFSAFKKVPTSSCLNCTFFYLIKLRVVWRFKADFPCWDTTCFSLVSFVSTRRKQVIQKEPLPQRPCSFPWRPSAGGRPSRFQQKPQRRRSRRWSSPRSASARSYTLGLPAAYGRLCLCQRRNENSIKDRNRPEIECADTSNGINCTKL